MKRTLVALLLAVLLLVFTGCSSTRQELVLTTGGTTGVYYIYGGEIAQMLMSKIENLQITTQTSGGSKANILALVEGEANLGWTQNDVMSYAYEGTEDFGGKPVEGFSAIGSLFPELVHLVVARDSGITSVEQLRGKNVAIGAIGSGVYFNAIQVLEMAGMTLDDITPHYLSFGESSESFQNRQIDAFFVTAIYPHSAIVDAAFKRQIDLIGFSDEEIVQLQERYPFYVANTVPAGSYSGVDYDVKVPAINAVVVASNELSEDTVYQIAKALFEGKDDLTNAKKEYLDVQTAVLGIPTCKSDLEKGIEGGSFHPGALKYYREIGVLK